MNKYIETAKKLKTLAERGIDGEKINAQKMLSAYLKKHKINIDDVTDKKMRCYYSVEKFDRRLFFQVLYSVAGMEVYYESYRYRKVMAELSLAEKIEFEIKYSAYKKAFEKAQKILFRAFVVRNNIFAKDAPGLKEADISDELREEMKKASLMANSLDRVNIHKQLKEAS